MRKPGKILIGSMGGIFAFCIAPVFAGGPGGSNAPQFIFGAARTVYEAPYRDLRAVEFANLTYRVRGVAPDLLIPMRNGTYEAGYETGDGMGFERAELRSVKICDNSRMPVPLAVVRLRYASGAGSSTCDEIVQLFEVSDGQLATLYEIVYACTSGGAYAVDCNAGTITATGTAWIGNDAHCCPSARDTAVFSFLGETLRLLSSTRGLIPIKSNSAK